MKIISGLSVLQIIPALFLIIIIGTIVGYWFQLIICFFLYLILAINYNLIQFEKWIFTKNGIKQTQSTSFWEKISLVIESREKHLKYQLIQKEKELSNLQNSLESIDYGMIKLSDALKVEWWNKVAGRLIDLREESDQGVHLLSLIRSPKFVEYIENEEFSDSLIIESVKDQEKSLEFKICPISKNGWILVIYDVSRLKKMERMRQDFVAHVSHELKTPLTVVLGYIELLSDSPNIPKLAKGYLEKTLRQSKKMNNTVDDLLLLSNLETSVPQYPAQMIDCDKLILEVQNQSIEILAVMDKSKTNIYKNKKTNLYIEGFYKELLSAVSNLVINAIRYSPNGSTINLEFGVQDDYGFISVIDNGPGIQSKHLSRLTERFYRADNSHSPKTGGTGLGLSIVKHILSRHDSFLEVESRIGEGSTFTCVFPPDRISES